MIKDEEIKAIALQEKIYQLTVEKNSLIVNLEDNFGKDPISQETKNIYQQMINDISLMIESLEKL